MDEEIDAMTDKEYAAFEKAEHIAMDRDCAEIDAGIQETSTLDEVSARLYALIDDVAARKALATG